MFRKKLDPRITALLNPDKPINDFYRSLPRETKMKINAIRKQKEEDKHPLDPLVTFVVSHPYRTYFILVILIGLWQV